MKKTWLLAALVFCAIVFPSAAQTTITTDPVGFTSLAIQPGMQTVGIPLLRPVVMAGAIQSSTNLSITVSGTTNVGALLESATNNITSSFYLEITSGSSSSYVGHRFDIDVPDTISAGNNSVLISGTSLNNTLSGSLPNLAGYNFAIRPHATLGSVFGTGMNGLLIGSTNSICADQVLLYSTSSGYATYFLYQSVPGAPVQWRNPSMGPTPFDNLPIPPGAGMFVNRTGTTKVTLTVLGDVRTTACSIIPLNAGYNFLANVYPVDRSPVDPAGAPDTTGMGFTVANNFAGSTSSATSDQLFIWGSAGYTNYFLFSSGATEQWRCAATGPEDYSTQALFPACQGFFIYCTQAHPLYSNNIPFQTP